MRGVNACVWMAAGWLAAGRLWAAGLTVNEDFAGDPAGRGWRTFGEAALFRWDAEVGRLAVTWDSSKSNSYFHLPLGRTLRKADEFELSFAVRLDAVQLGTTPGKPYTFEIAVGLLNFATATRPDFLRGTGFNSPNLLEWDYFPDSGFGATVAATLISEQHQWASSFNSPVPLETGVEYRFRLVFTPEDRRLRATMQAGESLTPLQDVRLTESFDDFSLDTLAVMSYSDAGQDPQFAGSIRAEGVVDDLRLVVPPPAIQEFRGAFEQGAWRATFIGRADFDYTLEASDDLRAWTVVAGPVPGTGAVQSVTDPRPPAAHAFYRLRAARR
jgi:hypothetical protein